MEDITNNKPIIYAVSEANNNISYVKGGNKLYLHTTISNIHNIEPYITTQRGVYILTGKGRVYIGEGEVYKRLLRHKTNKLWAEDVYVLVTEPMMTKEDSLILEGAFVEYFTNYTNANIDNKDATREDGIEVTGDIQKFSWLGLTAFSGGKTSTINNRNNQEVFTYQHTPYNTYKVINTTLHSLKWLMGYEFQSKEDLISIANTLVKQPNMETSQQKANHKYDTKTLQEMILANMPPYPIKKAELVSKYGSGVTGALNALVAQNAILRVKRGYYILSDDLLNTYDYERYEERKTNQINAKLLMPTKVLTSILSAFISKYTVNEVMENNLMGLFETIPYYTTTDTGEATTNISEELEGLKVELNKYMYTQEGQDVIEVLNLE